MPSLEIEILPKVLESSNLEFSIFVETGTYKGETINKFEPFFDKLYTIEIKPEFYQYNKDKYTGNKITFLLGDSSTVLNKLTLELDKNCIFFLDGHWSAGDTGRGSKDCPLYEELKSINDGFRHSAIIIIDDVRLFGRGPHNGEICNWYDINENSIFNILKDRTEKYYHLPSSMHPSDRLVYHLKYKSCSNKNDLI